MATARRLVPVASLSAHQRQSPTSQQGARLLSPLSSRNSQALAIFQSRNTVSGEICRTSAVSSTLKPAKYRNSTTRPLRGSILDSDS